MVRGVEPVFWIERRGTLWCVITLRKWWNNRVSPVRRSSLGGAHCSGGKSSDVVIHWHSWADRISQAHINMKEWVLLQHWEEGGVLLSGAARDMWEVSCLSIHCFSVESTQSRVHALMNTASTRSYKWRYVQAANINIVAIVLDISKPVSRFSVQIHFPNLYEAIWVPWLYGYNGYCCKGALNKIHIWERLVFI